MCVTPNAKPKICVTPNANPQSKSVEYRLRWVSWRWELGWACTFHVVCVNLITQTRFSVECVNFQAAHILAHFTHSFYMCKIVCSVEIEVVVH